MTISEIRKFDYINRLDKVHMMDPRQTKTSFYHSFHFDGLYSRPMFIQVMNGSRTPTVSNVYAIINNALTILEDNIVDNRPFFDREVGKDSIVMSTYKSICRSYPEFEISDRFANVTNYPGVNFPNVLRKAEPTPGAVDAYEAMTLGLLVSYPRYRNDFFANMRGYRRIKNIIMRAQLWDGLDVKTISEIADICDIDDEDLRHPERLCRDAERYMSAFESIIKKIPYFAIEKTPSNGRWSKNNIK